MGRAADGGHKEGEGLEGRRGGRDRRRRSWWEGEGQWFVTCGTWNGKHATHSWTGGGRSLVLIFLTPSVECGFAGGGGGRGASTAQCFARPGGSMCSCVFRRAVPEAGQ